MTIKIQNKKSTKISFYLNQNKHEVPGNQSIEINYQSSLPIKAFFKLWFIFTSKTRTISPQDFEKGIEFTIEQYTFHWRVLLAIAFIPLIFYTESMRNPFVITLLILSAIAGFIHSFFVLESLKYEALNQ